MGQHAYDAIVVISFGGPEQRSDVIPFLENVLKGRNVPEDRKLEVAQHYYEFEGVSPINQQCRDLITALEDELRSHRVTLPVYWGNRNWHPFLSDTVLQMKHDGIRNALAFVTSAYSSYSSCRQYRENIVDAQGAAGPSAPEITKIGVFFDHPDFVKANADRLLSALVGIDPQRAAACRVVFTAHSIPVSMATSCEYETQLRETCRLVSAKLGLETNRWQLVYQSRSGPPQIPWLGPDVCEYLETLRGGVQDCVIMPIGFLSDHMEVVYDLDYEAKQTCQEVGINMVRAETVGTHPVFVSMIRELIMDRLEGRKPNWTGQVGRPPAMCSEKCCPTGRPHPAASS